MHDEIRVIESRRDSDFTEIRATLASGNIFISLFGRWEYDACTESITSR